MHFRPRVVMLAVILVSMFPGRAPATGVAEVEHPFVLWTKDDLAALKKKIETEPWARKAYEEMVASAERTGDEARNLFRYAVIGDKKAGEVEKARLLNLVNSPDPLGAEFCNRLH